MQEPFHGLYPTLQDGVTALHAASFKGHLEVVELLLANWANPNLRDKVKQYSAVCTKLSNGVWCCIVGSFAMHKIYDCNSHISIPVKPY